MTFRLFDWTILSPNYIKYLRMIKERFLKVAVVIKKDNLDFILIAGLPYFHITHTHL